MKFMGTSIIIFLSTSEIYEVIPYATFDLSINNAIVKRKCTWPEFF